MKKLHRIHVTGLSLLLVCILFTAQGCRKDSDRKVTRNHKQSVGHSSSDFLSSKDYTKLIVEVQYFDGHGPTEEAINELKIFLNQRLNKPGGIEVVWNKIASPGKAVYSLGDIENIETFNRKEFTSGKNIAAYFLFLDGEYSENSGNSKVLGIAYRNTSMAIFEKTIMELSGGITQPQRYKLEATVINHEFAHILGLVDIGTPMQSDHKDEAHGNHCDNTSCLMNWTAETGDAVSNLIGSSPIPGLDQNCINDLKANGGK